MCEGKLTFDERVVVHCVAWSLWFNPVFSLSLGRICLWGGFLQIRPKDSEKKATRAVAKLWRGFDSKFHNLETFEVVPSSLGSGHGVGYVLWCSYGEAKRAYFTLHIAQKGV